MKHIKLKIIITNLVTLIRVIGIFALIPVYYNYGGFATFTLSAICFLTDTLDGVLARGFNCSTFFGSLFDGISDKSFLIVNLILLLLITKLAIIPISLEIIIFLIQLIKFNNNLNVKANMFGKVKMWVAGITICLCYFIVDKALDNRLLLILMVILGISELLTIISYIKELIDGKTKKDNEDIENKKKEEKILATELKGKTLSYIWFSPDFYSKYKDHGNLKLIRSLVKNVKKD